MAIRIDLLPGYVGMRKWFKRVLAVCLVLVAAVGAVLYLMYYKKQQQLKQLEADVEMIEPTAKRTEDTQTKTQAAVADAAPMQAAVNFMADAAKTGAERAALIDLVRRYVYNGAVVHAIDLSDGQTLKIGATMRTPDDYARFVLNLRKGTDPNGPLFQTAPNFGGIPSFPPPLEKTPQSGAGGQTGAASGGAAAGAAGPAGAAAPIAPNEPQIRVFPLNITGEGKLKNPVTIPVEAAGG